MRRFSKYIISILWVVLIYALFKLDLLSGSVDNLNQFLDSCGKYKVIIFILLSTFRIGALIPSAVFMILGGMIFNPVEGFLLTLISVILSESIIYAISKILVGTDIQKHMIAKYPKLYELLQQNNAKILSIGILCPAAPSDVACFLSSSTDISYKKFIITVILANFPMMMLYSFLGSSVINSTLNTVIIAAAIVMISGYSIHLWVKAQKQHKLV